MAISPYSCICRDRKVCFFINALIPKNRIGKQLPSHCSRSARLAFMLRIICCFFSFFRFFFCARNVKRTVRCLGHPKMTWLLLLNKCHTIHQVSRNWRTPSVVSTRQAISWVILRFSSLLTLATEPAIIDCFLLFSSFCILRRELH